MNLSQTASIQLSYAVLISPAFINAHFATLGPNME